MPTSAPGNRKQSSGFTLLELLVVVAIIAVASAGVALTLRDTAGAPLERDAQRLAALLESARAQSRLSGRPVRWVATGDAFRFDGLAPGALPQQWLDEGTRAVGPAVLLLGPEPVIGAQSVVLTSAAHPDRTLRIATDGLRPFRVGAEAPP